MPLLDQLFLLSFESARWKLAQVTPQNKKGPLLDSNSHPMLAVGGTMYRLSANVIRSLLTTWCIPKARYQAHSLVLNQAGILCNPYSFSGTCSTLPVPSSPITRPGCIKPLLTSNRLMTLSPERLSRLTSAAYACLFPSSLSLKACILATSASYKTGINLLGLSLLWVQNKSVVCLSLLFLLYINDIGMITEGMKIAVTETEDVHVMHMLYADELTPLANAPGALQTMLNRRAFHARFKHLTINTDTAKSEVFHFNSKPSAEVPIFKAAGAQWSFEVF